MTLERFRLFCFLLGRPDGGNNSTTLLWLEILFSFASPPSLRCCGRCNSRIIGYRSLRFFCGLIFGLHIAIAHVVDVWEFLFLRCVVVLFFSSLVVGGNTAETRCPLFIIALLAIAFSFGGHVDADRRPYQSRISDVRRAFFQPPPKQSTWSFFECCCVVVFLAHCNVIASAATMGSMRCDGDALRHSRHSREE